MFESVAPEIFVRRSRKLLYETLPLSIALHGVIVVAVMTATSWNVVFPTQTPKMAMMYNLEDLPTPPPPPPPPAPPKRVDTPQQVRPVMKEDLAPTVIPDEIPLVLPQVPQPVQAEVTDAVGGVEGGVEGGVIGGDVQGVQGGEIGGVIGGDVGSIGTTPPDTVVIKRDMPLPTAPMSMVYPAYPDDARVRGYEDTVVVRYIIGRDGRVREVIVLSRPEHEVFETITVKAIRHWRFRPYKKDGVAQEIVHELTIYFRLQA
jgi:protein TonB